MVGSIIVGNGLMGGCERVENWRAFQVVLIN